MLVEPQANAVVNHTAVTSTAQEGVKGAAALHPHCLTHSSCNVRLAAVTQRLTLRAFYRALFDSDLKSGTSSSFILVSHNFCLDSVPHAVAVPGRQGM